jgi:subtilisin family serine protease
MVLAQAQVERILDEDTSATVGVLVQVAAPAQANLPVDTTIGLSAREALPAPVRRVLRGRQVPGALRLPVESIDAIRHDSNAALGAVLNSEPARNGRIGAAFWTSRTAYLELDRDDLSRLLAEAPGVVEVHPNHRLTLPPVARSRELPAAVREDSAASWGITASGALSVWGAYAARGAGVTVGVLDTGVDPTHPDLAGKVAKWAEFDAQGQQVPGSEPHDSGSHGTHVCGTIAGGDASGQWIGMAPDAKLAMGLVLKGGSGTVLQVLGGIQWAVEQKVDVLSMSLSAALFEHQAPNVFSAAFVTALRAGIPVVAAIGNEGAQTGASTGSDYFSLAVGATDHRDVPAGFSGGQTQVVATSPLIRPEFLPLIYTKPDISAPGVDVVSSVPDAAWEAFNGTSMATPHVAGAIALLLSAVPSIRDLSGLERAFFIQDMISGSVDELGEAGKDARYGFGRLNVLRAIALAKRSQQH